MRSVVLVGILAVLPQFISLCAAQTDEQKRILEGPLDAYNRCIFPKAVAFAHETSESAESIRDAALAACYLEREDAMKAMRLAGANEIDIQELDQHVSQQLILAVVSTRAKN